MQLWRTFDEVDVGPGGASVALGVFDGIHRGHQVLIDTTLTAAAPDSLTPVLVTFDPHPVEVVRSGTHPELLTSIGRRAQLAAEHGMAATFALPFDTEVAAWAPEDFVDRVLVETLRAGAVTVGSNFTFGRGAAGTPDVLRELCAERGIVCHVVDLERGGGEVISSTRIRGLLADCDVAGAAALLGRPHRVTGTVVRGAGRGGRELGYPTANLDLPDHTAVPGDGVYAGWFTVDSPPADPTRGSDSHDGLDGSMTTGVAYPAAVSVGTNPTFGECDRSVEAYVLDETCDLYGCTAAVDFVDHVRAMEKFTSVDELLEAMGRDVATTRGILGLDPSD